MGVVGCRSCGLAEGHFRRDARLRDANWLTTSFLEGPEGPEGPKDADDASSCLLLPARASYFLRRSFPVVHRRSPPGRRARSKLCRSSRSRAHLPSSSAPLCYDSAGFVIGSAVVLHSSQPGIHGPSAVGNQQCEWPAHACPRRLESAKCLSIHGLAGISPGSLGVRPPASRS